MKKYKNIKTGIILESVDNFYCLEDSHFFRIPKEFVENSDEWEEIKKEVLSYEIVSVKIQNLDIDAIFTFDSKGVCTHRTDKNSAKATFPLDKMLNNPDIKNLEIYSIRRISDGAVFTIGDRLMWDWSYSSVDYFTLKEIFISEGEVAIVFDNGNVYETLFNEKKFNLRLFKETPLFITEDKVEVYNSNLDSIWWVNTKFFEIGNDVDSILDKTDYLFFSKKEKAESYIVENKPLFSLNDIRKVMGSNINRKKLAKFAKKACEIKN